MSMETDHENALLIAQFRADLAAARELLDDDARWAESQLQLGQALRHNEELKADLAAARGERDRLDGELGFGVAALAICQRDLAAAREKLDLYEQALIDLRDDAAVIANNGSDEADRKVGRRMILLCEKAFVRRAALDAAAKEAKT